MKRLALFGCLLALIFFQLLGAPPAIADGCGNTGQIFTGGTGNTGVDVDGSKCNGATDPGKTSPASSGPATRTLTCDLSAGVSPGCEGAATTCLRPPLAPPTNVAVVEQQQPDGSWQQIGVDCEGNAADAIAVTAAMVRQEVVRLLPPVAVGVAPADGPTLVNLETIFWSPTDTERALGPVTILAQQVAITIRFDHATYDYGDGTTGTVDSPGTAWTKDLCNTAQCPTLDGHTYTRPADRLTAASTITWTASFSVSGGPEQPIPGTIDGPTAEHELQVLEGRSILVR